MHGVVGGGVIIVRSMSADTTFATGNTLWMVVVSLLTLMLIGVVSSTCMVPSVVASSLFVSADTTIATGNTLWTIDDAVSSCLVPVVSSNNK
jgi:hypothetical protein